MPHYGLQNRDLFMPLHPAVAPTCIIVPKLGPELLLNLACRHGQVWGACAAMHPATCLSQSRGKAHRTRARRILAVIWLLTVAAMTGSRHAHARHETEACQGNLNVYVCTVL